MTDPIDNELEKKADLIHRKTKHFKQYKNMSKAEHIEIIKANLQAKEDEGLVGSTVKREEVEELNLDMLFPEGEDRKSSRSLARKYLSDFSIETVSDRNTLVSLIYLEVIQSRLQKMINDMYTKSNIVPLQMLDSLHKNLTEISEIKEKLGISRKKLDGDKKSAIELIELMKKKFKKYREQNQLSRNMVCPHCGQMCLLKIRTDKYDTIAHPFFKDRILSNVHLVKLYKLGTITKEDVMAILGCSGDYVTWLVDKWTKGNRHKEDEVPPTEELESGVTEAEIV
jgi:hypothetical protein